MNTADEVSKIKKVWHTVLLASGGLCVLLFSSFSICRLFREDLAVKPTGGKRISQVEPVLEGLSFPFKTAAGPGKITLRKAWIENYRYTRFLVVGGMKRLVLDGLTFYVPLRSNAPLNLNQRQYSNDSQFPSSSFEDVLLSSVKGRGGRVAFTEMKIRRVEFVWLVDGKEFSFLRAGGAAVKSKNAKAIRLIDAWYRESASGKWQKLSSATLCADEKEPTTFLRLCDSLGQTNIVHLPFTILNKKQNGGKSI